MYLTPCCNLPIFNLVSLWCHLLLNCFVSTDLRSKLSYLKKKLNLVDSRTFPVRDFQCFVNYLPRMLPCFLKRFQYFLCFVLIRWLFLQLRNFQFWNFESTTYNVGQVLLWFIKCSGYYFFCKYCKFFLSQ